MRTSRRSIKGRSTRWARPRCWGSRSGYEMRELNRHLRETGESRGLNAAFTARNRSGFLQTLDEAVRRRSWR